MTSPPTTRKRKRSARTLPAGLPGMEGAESDSEVILLHRCKLLRLPTPETQVELIPARKLRYDVVFTEYRIAIEVQGGQPSKYRPEEVGGAHNRGPGYQQDCIKSALAQIRGYMVIAVTPDMISKGVAGLLILEALKARGWRPPT